MAAQPRLRAALKYKKKNILQVIALAKAILAKMQANAIYASTPVQFSVLAQQIKDLEDAQHGVKMKLVTASFRDTKRDAVVTSLETLMAFVQGLADGAGEQAASIIEGAGMKVVQASTYAKPILDAKLGLTAGSVDVLANAGQLRRRPGYLFYNWQFSVNGGASWQSAPSTPHAQTTITGLPAMTVCAFRVCITDRDGTAEWSQVVTILVQH